MKSGTYSNCLTLTVLALVGCKSSGDISDTQVPAVPSVSISASPETINSGQSTMLTWSSTNADSCIASGDWNGPRTTNGSEEIGPLSADSEFTLACTGRGGESEKSASVIVTASPAAPMLNFSVSPETVNQGDTAILTWSATNADTCSASGGWSGSKPVSGTESTGTLSADASFTLRCVGAGGDAVRTRFVSVVSSSSDGNFTGSVDSSLINRSGQNAVYLFSGSTSPDDIDGDSGDPVATATVRQDTNACTFSYGLGPVAAGDYTIAFTSDAADDSPSRDDTISFYGASNVSVGSNGAISDFDAANVIRVGPGHALQTVAAAANAASDGDVIEIEAGIYPADVASWYQNNLTIRGVGGYAHMRADGANAQGKAIWIIAGSDTVVENVEFSNVTVPDQNGAGIRAEGRNLTVCNGYFHDSDEGILGGNGEVLIEYSEFANNGFGDGFSHNMYILEGTEKFTLRHSYIHHARIGHNVKSRARENHILYNRIMDEQTGNASYAVDVPNGGLTFIIGNLIQQGPNTDNSSMVNYGTEGLRVGRTHNLYLVNNTLVDDYGGTFIQAAGGTASIQLVNNLFVGSSPLVSGPVPVELTNLRTTTPDLANLDGFDYRLTTGSPARDAGTPPGFGDGVSLVPEFQYMHQSGREDRPADATIDIGAYEFAP